MKMELVLVRNAVGEEIKLYSSEKNSPKECAEELLQTIQKLQSELDINKIKRMIKELEKSSELQNKSI